jgi:hypothetical protein
VFSSTRRRRYALSRGSGGLLDYILLSIPPKNSLILPFHVIVVIREDISAFARAGFDPLFRISPHGGLRP